MCWSKPSTLEHGCIFEIYTSVFGTMSELFGTSRTKGTCYDISRKFDMNQQKIPAFAAVDPVGRLNGVYGVCLEPNNQ